jgi:alkylhydroperoxidase family enzyme
VHIEDGYVDSDLPDRYKMAIDFADALIRDPGSVSDPIREPLRTQLLKEFTPEEIVELAMTITMAMGFSKLAIAWGPPPSMPVTEVPTPAPDTTVV